MPKSLFKNGVYVGPETFEGVLRPESTDPVVSLGNLKRVRGSIDFRNYGHLRDLGKLEVVNGYMDVEGNQLTTLGNLTLVKGGYLDVSNNHALHSLGKLMRVVGTLYIRGTAITSLGDLEVVVGTESYPSSAIIGPDYSTYSLQELQEILEMLRSVPVGELSSYLYDPKYAHPLFQYALRDNENI